MMTQLQPPRLLEQVRQAIRMKHFSLKTEKSYVYYIRDFILFHDKRHPQEMGVAEIRAYLSHLAVNQRGAASTQTVALSALLFLYRQVLQVELPDIEGIEWANRSEHLHDLEGYVLKRAEKLATPLSPYSNPVPCSR